MEHTCRNSSYLRQRPPGFPHVAKTWGRGGVCCISAGDLDFCPEGTPSAVPALSGRPAGQTAKARHLAYAVIPHNAGVTFRRARNPFPIYRNLFPIYRNPFPIDRNPFPIYRNPFPIYRNPFPIYRNLFPIYRNPFPIYRNPFPIYRNPFPIYRNPFPIYRNLFPIYRNPFDSTESLKHGDAKKDENESISRCGNKRAHGSGGSCSHVLRHRIFGDPGKQELIN
jgi:hypothetical protein